MDGVYTSKSDMWMFGVLMWGAFVLKTSNPLHCSYSYLNAISSLIFVYHTEIFMFGLMPWTGVSDAQVIVNARKGVTMQRPPLCPVVVYNIAQACWELDPNARISAAEAERRLTAITPQQLETPDVHQQQAGQALAAASSTRTSSSSSHTPYRHFTQSSQFDDDEELGASSRQASSASRGYISLSVGHNAASAKTVDCDDGDEDENAETRL